MTQPSREKLEHFTGGHEVGVDVAAIERELSALWRKASQDGHLAVSRACAWNLVFCCLEPGSHPVAKTLAEGVVAAVPSRTLIVHHQPRAEGAEVEAYVTAHCRLSPEGGKLLCAEEITIESRRTGFAHVPALLRALLVPDIPAALVCVGRPPEERALGDALTLGFDQLVVDTRHAEGPSELSRIERLWAKSRVSRLADLTWLRLSPFRLALAGMFDPPNGPEPLSRLRRIAVTCAADGLATAQLFVGWLAHALSWRRLRANSEREWEAATSAGPVEITVAPSTEPGPFGLSEVSLVTHRDERLRLKQLSAAALDIDASFAPARRIGAYAHTDAELLVAALGTRGRDRLYGQALRRALELSSDAAPRGEDEGAAEADR